MVEGRTTGELAERFGISTRTTRVLRSFTPEFRNVDQNWDPVWYVRNC